MPPLYVVYPPMTQTNQLSFTSAFGIQPSLGVLPPPLTWALPVGLGRTPQLAAKSCYPKPADLFFDIPRGAVSTAPKIAPESLGKPTRSDLPT